VLSERALDLLSALVWSIAYLRCQPQRAFKTHMTPSSPLCRPERDTVLTAHSVPTLALAMQKARR